MYRILKKIYIALIPSFLKFKIEPHIRNLIFKLAYKGNAFLCPICKAELNRFITYKFENFDDKICPKCGSLSRTRSLTLYIENSFDFTGYSILDFSPHRSFYNYWQKKNVNYVANDFENEFLAHTNYDITSLKFNTEDFDLIICYHILEHVQDDDKAIEELFRVLKNKGVLIAQVPFTNKKTDEDLSITSPELRIKRFGQEDHVRYYGKNDFIQKLELKGFTVETCLFSKTLPEKKIIYYGLHDQDTIFICKK